MIDLKNTTFIIPVGIESEDRRINATTTLAYLCKHLSTNIIIYEYDTESKISKILSKINPGNTKIQHIFKNSSGNPIFHRTKFLNEMLDIVTTPVVVNYDVDILLRPQTYVDCVDMICNKNFDLVYPYFFGDSQWQVMTAGRDIVAKTLLLDDIQARDAKICRSEYGQCQFFNTASYKAGGKENEGFVSYAPEDQERAYRFEKLGYNVTWMAENYIYHLEHFRGPNSSSENPKMQENNDLFKYIKTLSKEELAKYYLTLNQ